MASKRVEYFLYAKGIVKGLLNRGAYIIKWPIVFVLYAIVLYLFHNNEHLAGDLCFFVIYFVH